MAIILNAQQQQAVTYVDGPLLVLAGAGSGKTRVITQKIHHIITHLSVQAKQICALTFTNKAAQEMNHRLSLSLSPAQKKGLKIGTFHHLGLEFLKREYQEFGLSKRFSLLDEEDARQLLKGFLPKSMSSDKPYLYDLLNQFSLWKNAMLTEDDLRQKYPQDYERIDYYVQYQAMLRACQAVDFDDLIVWPVLGMKANPNLLQKWQQRWRYILVDEYQDTNLAQYELIKCLIGPYTQLTVVGDDDQSIYAWRGANPENLKTLSEDFKSLKLIKLEQNYRSSGYILEAANCLIANNEHVFTKALWSELGPGDFLRAVETADDIKEAEWVVLDILSHKYQHSAAWGDYAILYRGNHQARHLERFLRQHHMPYQLSGGQSWFARTEIKDMLAYLKLSLNAQDDASFLRVINTPKRGIGEKSLQVLSQYAKSRGLPLLVSCDHLAIEAQVSADIFERFTQFKSWLSHWSHRLSQDSWPDDLWSFFLDIGFEAYWYEDSDNPVQVQKKMERVQDLVDWIKRLKQQKPDLSLLDALHKLMLIDLLSEDEQDESKLQLMTLHAAKGLEFPYVYLLGMEEGLLPHQQSIEQDALAEERRLAYVGITRAQKKLTFTYAKKRKRAGEWVLSQSSRFLEELPEHSLQWFRLGQEDPELSKKLAKQHLSGLKDLLTI